MTVSNQTLEYYSSISGLSDSQVAFLCEPTQLIGGNAGESVMVRDLRYGHTHTHDYSGPREVYSRSAYEVTTVMTGILSVIKRDLKPELTLESIHETNAGLSINGNTLIAPSIKTGKLTELIMQLVAPDELPASPAVKDGIYKEYFPDRKATYLLKGKLSMGSYSGTVACAAALFPFANTAFIGFEDRYKRYSGRSVTALDQWELSKSTARAREATNKLRPLNGGLPS